MNSVLTLRKAMELGFRLNDYTYKFDQIPTGEFLARLDLKIWSKRIMAINGYFTSLEKNEKFQLTVYCLYETGRYMLPGGNIEFLSCNTGVVYQVMIHRRNKSLQVRIFLVEQ